ncbi:hypothetical protein LS73_008640 [Helicobacter muridarum]|uniref:NADP-specific glutamate dehydrogenase n=1 Tax=Helicobacter muridarum TaxID=216 RepID=A0A099TWW0_9HELI|nr:hypothetical protein [Helicobacter muridarum]TLD98584.1 hypothetical protein LS73_008640 [Helicobacter muridarum]STQ85530.1 NADP-specific glutamate dehydrogenase [Helicobacter muridarum]
MQTHQPFAQAIIRFIKNSFDNSFLDSTTQDFINHINMKFSDTTHLENINNSDDIKSHIGKFSNSIANLPPRISLSSLKDSSLNSSKYLYENLFDSRIDEAKLEFFLPSFYSNKDKSHIFGFFGEGDYMLVEALIGKCDISSIAVLSLQYAICLLLALHSNMPIIIVLHETNNESDDFMLFDSTYNCVNGDYFSSVKKFIDNDLLYNNHTCIERFFVGDFSCICEDNLFLSCASLLLKARGLSFKDKFCSIKGNSKFCLELVRCLHSIHAKPIAISNNKGLLYDSKGLSFDLLQSILEQIMTKNLYDISCNEDLLEIYSSRRECEFFRGENIASMPCFVALLGYGQAVERDIIQKLLSSGCKYIIELYPNLDLYAQRLLIDSKICYMPFSLVGCVYFMQYMYDKEKSSKIKLIDMESSSKSKSIKSNPNNIAIELNSPDIKQSKQESIISSFSLLLQRMGYDLSLDSNTNMRFIGMQEILNYILNRD